MSIKTGFLAELEHEAISTRSLLAVVPLDKSDWKPHTKSMDLGSLTSHTAELFSWIDLIINTNELDFSSSYQAPPKFTNTEEFLAHFDKMIEKSKTALTNADDAIFHENWTLRVGDKILFTLPKVAAIRTFTLNHLYHHRGQLTVYLRLLDIKLPGIYGPSADSVG